MAHFVRPPAQPLPFEDLPSTDTPVSAAWLNAVDDALAEQVQQRLRLVLATRDAGPRVVAFCGSSTTAGENATQPARRYVNVLSAMMQAAYPLRTGAASPAVRTLAEAVAAGTLTAGVQGVNAGVSGATAANYLTSTTRGQVAGLNPVCLIHIIGTNDYAANIDPATYQANLTDQLSALDTAITSPHLHILVHAYRRRDVSSPTYPWTDFAARLAAVAALDPGRRLVLDISAPYEFAGIGGADPLDLLDTDLVHQTDAGHAVMAELIRDGLAIPTAASVTVTGSGSTSGQLAATALLPTTQISAGAGGGVGADPAAASGLVALFRASSLSLADGAAVASWSPTAGAETAPLAQGNAGQRPVYRTGVVNGRAVVEFTAANTHHLDTGAWGTSRPDPLTVVAVVRRTAGNQGVLWTGRNGVNAYAGFGSDGQLEYGSATVTDNTTWTATAWNIVVAVFDGASSRIYINSVTADPGVVGGDAELPGLRLASNSSGNGAFLSGQIAEVGVIGRAAPDVEIGDWVEFLADRYAITVT